MKFDYHIDLFSGIGGFSLGLKQTGFEFGNTYFSEINKYAISIYKRNFVDAKELGSVKLVHRRSIKGRTGIITFGFPCQDLSIVGRRRGLGKGSRSSLFYEAMRIIGELRPDYFIFENVKNLFSINGGKDFVSVLRTIADTGYDGQWILANTKWFLPQNRERIYFIGHIAGKRGSEIFSFRKRNNMFEEPKTLLREHTRTRTITACYGKSSGDSSKIKTSYGVRLFTPLEIERLQGFPDNWTKKGIDENNTEVEVSDNQRYKTLGNAVSVPVVSWVSNHIKQQQ